MKTAFNSQNNEEVRKKSPFPQNSATPQSLEVRTSTLKSQTQDNVALHVGSSGESSQELESAVGKAWAFLGRENLS